MDSVSLSKVLNQIRPGTQWVINDGILTWLDTTQTQPTDTELQSGLAQLQTNQLTQAQSVANAKANLSTKPVGPTPDPRVDALITILKANGLI